MQKSTDLNWDDVRFVVALSERGSLSGAARALGVDHTTVGRRVESAEAALGVRLFTRSATGYTLSFDGGRLLPTMRRVAEAVHTVVCEAQAGEGAIRGVLRVTAPETFGMSWLATRLATFGAAHPGLTIALDPTGAVADLARGEAEIALRTTRARVDRLVAKRVADLGYGWYATARVLSAHPIRSPEDLAQHRLLTPPPDPPSVESRWVARLVPEVEPALVSELSMVLLAAAKAHGGVAVLPRYLGDAETTLQHVAVGPEPTEPLWLTVHEDARRIPRVRAVIDDLVAAFDADRDVLRGKGRSSSP